MCWGGLRDFLICMLFVVNSELDAMGRHVVRHGSVGSLCKPLTRVGLFEGVCLTRKDGHNKRRNVEGKSHLKEN